VKSAINFQPAAKGVFAECDLGDGRVAHIVLLTFGRGRISVGPAGQQYYDQFW
jgi:hypothetical protein